MVNLYCVYYAQDDPKKNTALRLKRASLLRVRDSIHRCPKRALVLTPFAEKVLSPEDKPLLEKYGLIVLDCSWNQILNTIDQSYGNRGRTLPRLLASNPVNYGKWGRLSSAEALAGALMVAGIEDQARELMAKFRWGHTFFDLNAELF